MSNPDAARWNERYRQEEGYAASQPVRQFLVDQADLLPHSGKALVAAMGAGRNAGWLLERGLEVYGVDVSAVAVRRAKARWPDLRAVIADLTSFSLPEAFFNLITNFYYLERGIWPLYRIALRPGGLLIVETLADGMQQVRPDIDPKYLLTPGELESAFADWEILYAWEGWDRSRPEKPRVVARLVARKPELPDSGDL